MIPLARQLRSQIEIGGPLTVAQYMAAALGHPRHGYYMSGDPLGQDGDFVTAPEISQMFGEIIGLWCVAGWEQMGRPDPALLVELGPGRGTLMSDALRAMALAPACRSALEVHLVETSPCLAETQRRRLAGVPAAWHDTLQSVPEGPLILVTNELFDALPIHQFVRTLGAWRERLVDIDPATDGFRFVLAPGPTPATALIPEDAAEAPPGSVVEASPAAIGLANEIGRRISTSGGVALIIDYGTAGGGVGDTFQAVRRHGRHEVLDAPGTADLSARVDFATIARVAREAGAEPFGPVAQGDFLRALGIETRADGLKRNATPAQRTAIDAALERLIDPTRMGVLFQALAIAPAGAPPPAGFEPAGLEKAAP